jgi:NAD(P)-dependent dehydrogenase (short-subunit alcohol dehydrogenase family)
MNAPAATDTPTAAAKAARPENRGRFAGKVALITGASDKGIGGAIARRLTSEGGSVSLLSRHEPVQLLKRLRKQHADHTLFSLGDICVPSDVTRAIDATLGQFGKLDILVNNAGIDESGSLEEFSDSQWDRVLEINLTGAMRMSRAVLPHLPQPGGVIVNVASALGLGGCQNFTAYSASKAGMIGFTQSLAAELAPRGQRVVAVAPALVITPMARRYSSELNLSTWDRLEKCHPLGVGLPDDVAAAVAFLASADARWITGITLPLGWMPSFPLPTDLLGG